MSKRILVITSCTGEKVHNPDNKLIINDFVNKSRMIEREQELTSYKERAVDMYTGRQHVELMKGIKYFRDQGNQIDVDILSAGYGLIREDDVIVPYEVTFNTMDSTSIKNWSKRQGITETFTSRIKDYDLIFLLFGDKYLQSIEWPVELHHSQKFIFFAGESSKSRVLWNQGEYLLSIGEKEAKKFGCGLIWAKGTLFSYLLRKVASSASESWDKIYDNPEMTRELILDYFEENKQLELFGEDESILEYYDELFSVPQKLVSKNFRSEFRFYMPENDDRVDPNFNFNTDHSEKNRNPLINDVYAHEIYGRPQYDGILISKTTIDKSTQQKKKLIKELGIRKFLKLPSDYPIMGDCGAFSYIGDEKPPYTTEEVIQYYEDLGFNYGVSIDHLVVGPFRRDEGIRNYRYELTLENAKDFLIKHKEMGSKFEPIGVVQGWDPASFRKAVEHLISLGYRRVALGGLARDKSELIYAILKEISPVIPDENFRLHLFGVARDMRTMKSFHKLGMTSFDSASPLRRAWLGTGHNYHTVQGKHYTAIRIPEASETTGRVKKMIEEGKGEFAQYKELEQNALIALRSFDNNQIPLDEALEAILAYDDLLGENRDSHKDLYRELLLERPWEQCACTICNEIGIDSVIFRGNNRNRRRGFHNTYAYYCQVQKLREELDMTDKH